jgi:hypothetical protein
VWATLQTRNEERKEQIIDVFDPTRPAPSIIDGKHSFGDKEFAGTTEDGFIPNTGRPVRSHKVLKIVGHTNDQINTWKADEDWDWNKSRIRTRDTIPTTTLVHVFADLYASEMAAKDNYDEEHMNLDVTEDAIEDEHGEGLKNDTYRGTIRAKTLLTKVINRWTTYSVPTTETWRAMTSADDDLSKIITAFQQGRRLVKADIHKKAYYHEWAKGRLEENQGILFQLEAPRLSKIR